MKTLGLSILFLAIMTGCTSTQAPKASKPEVAKVILTDKFQFNGATLHLSELIDADVAYHTERELQEMLNSKFRSLLENKNLLAQDKRGDTLVVNVSYERRFVGDKTPFPSSSLAYPSYAYSIKIIDNDKPLASIEQDKKGFRGGLTMSKQVVAKSLNDKSYENIFINGLANDIFKSLQALK